MSEARTGYIVSGIVHATVLGWGLISLSSPKPLDSEPVDSIMVEVITESNQSQARAGQQKAKMQDQPKPKVEKIAAETKPAPEPEIKVADKPEITTASTSPPPPPQPPEPVVQKPVETPPSQPEPTPKPQQQAKPEPIKPEPKEPETVTEAPKPTPIPARKPEPPKEIAKPLEPQPQQPPQPQQAQPDQKKFDTDKIAALLDQRAPQRQAATGQELNTQTALGTRTGTSARLSQSELDALRARIQQCWNPPVGAANAQELIVIVRFALNRDGTLTSGPIIANRGSSPHFQSAAESALRAVRRCEPYSMLPSAKYDSWKDIEITFDPRDMFRT